MTSTSGAHAGRDRDERYLRRAIELARRARGGVGPRAPVGAVVVKAGEVVGEGATEPRPGDHAEVVALRQAGERARGADLYCTLEPHAHQSTVPACTEAIISAGVRRVVSAHRDPNPQVDGAGYDRLREAGVEVTTDVPAGVARDAAELVEGFAKHLRTGMPFVTAKYAMTLDGKIAARTGESKWITGDAARARAHELRAASDAVIVGIGTVLKDDSRLTARVPWATSFASPRPRFRVVVDSRWQMPEAAALLREPGHVIQAVAQGPQARPEANRPSGKQAPAGDQAAELESVRLPAVDGAGVDLAALLKLLGERGCTTAMVEGGSTLLGAFFALGLVDRVVAFIAPRIFGGADAPGAVGGPGVSSPADAAGLKRVTVERLDADLMISGYVAR